MLVTFQFPAKSANRNLNATQMFPLIFSSPNLIYKFFNLSNFLLSDIEICTMATAKLHILVQTRDCSTNEENAFLMLRLAR